MVEFQAPGTSALLLRALQRYPDRIALRSDRELMSYRATSERIGRMQAVLSAAGYGRGTRVVMLGGNSCDAWCASMAAQACGMAVSWLNALGSLEDHLFQIQDYRATVMIADVRTHGERVHALTAACHDPLSLHTLGPGEGGPDLCRQAGEVGHAMMKDLSSGSDLALVNYTGGTTGRGKGVLRDQVNLGNVTRAVLASFEMPSRPNFLCAAPVSHVAGTLLLPVLAMGGTVRLLERFSPERVLEVIGSEGIDSSILVPTMIYSLLDSDEMERTDVSTLKTILYGASPMTPSRLREAIERIGPVFAQLYGQTEAYPVTYLAREDHDPSAPELLSSCGLPTPTGTLALMDDQGVEVPVGEIGEICVRGPHIMQGYLGLPELTAETMQAGWLHTGDMARRDERGYLWIVDRKKDLVVSGGFNVYPREVEDVIAGDPAVAEVAVIGVPHPRWGEAVTALVVRRAGAANEPSERLADRIIELVRTRKGAVHAPKAVEFVDALPRTAVGKIDKKALKAPYWADRDRGVA